MSKADTQGAGIRVYNRVLMKKKLSKTAASTATSRITLSVDIGGTGLKMMALDDEGRPVSDRVRALTPDNPTPPRLLKVLEEMCGQMPPFDRVSVGFPGVVKNGVTLAAHNLSPKWAE